MSNPLHSELELKLISSYKNEMISFMETHPECFYEAIELAISDKEKLCWRSAWLLWSAMEKNDPRIRPHINKIIKVIPEKEDGHQRELLKILSKMKLNEEQEGILFNICLNLWEALGKTPSIRHIAFKFIIKTAKNYPELKSEIEFLTQQHYLETLSPGVKRSISKMVKEAAL